MWREAPVRGQSAASRENSPLRRIRKRERRGRAVAPQARTVWRSGTWMPVWQAGRPAVNPSDDGRWSCQPIMGAFTRRPTRREAGGQQIAASRGFPIEHFAGNEEAGYASQHVVLVHLAPGNAAGRRYRLADRPWAQ